jgi:hypothetical protein
MQRSLLDAIAKSAERVGSTKPTSMLDAASSIEALTSSRGACIFDAIAESAIFVMLDRLHAGQVACMLMF